MRYWGGQCAVTGLDIPVLPRASHIKPWRDSNNRERLDPYNGLLLSPSYDAAFDAGLIAFADDGAVVLTGQLTLSQIDRLGRDIAIIHGGSPGVDESFNKACRSVGITVEARVANWPHTGHPTIGSRNRELVKDGADLCIAVHRRIGASQRTRDCVDQAIQADIPTFLIADERAIPSRLTRTDPRL
jgi:hypothetical protein